MGDVEIVQPDATVEVKMPYNGWSNYETWNVNLWAMNEEPLYRRVMAQKPYDAKKAAKVALELFPDGTPDFHGAVHSWSWVPKVDWQEIADAWNEE